MNKAIKDIIGVGIRAALYTIFGGMISRGVVTAEQVDSWVNEFTIGLAGFAVTVGLSLFQKYRARLFGATALDLPAGSTAEDVKYELKDVPLVVKIRRALGL